MSHLEKLESITVEMGSPFPFSVETVQSIADWQPKPLVVAVSVDEKAFRVMESESDNTTPNALREIVTKNCVGIHEWKSPPGPADESQPSSSSVPDTKAAE